MQQDTDRQATVDLGSVVDFLERQEHRAVDLIPIAEVIHEQHQQIAKQADRIAELSAAAALWQSRAMHLEEQVKQLTATADEAAESPETNDTDDQGAVDDVIDSSTGGGVWARLARWWTGRG